MADPNNTGNASTLSTTLGTLGAIFEWQNPTAGHNVTVPEAFTEEGMTAEERELVEDLHRMAQISIKLVPIVIVFILVLGLIGNFLVVYVTVATNRTAKHPIHSLFVLNLAAADVLFLLASAPYQIASHSGATWRFGSFLCPFIPFTATCSMFASIYTICALAWMRFMALVMPFRFQSSLFSTRKAGYVVILIIWISGTVLSIPNLVHYTLKEVKAHSLACVWDGDQTAFAIVKLVMTYFLPLILMTVFYAVIGREVLCYMMKHGRKTNQTAGGRSSAEDQQECAKSAMVVLSLILAFLICWLPHMLQTVFKAAGVNTGNNNIKARFILEVTGQCMSYAHACINPFIYTFASPLLRRNLRTSVRQKIQNCRNSNDTCGNTSAVRIVRKRGPASRFQNLRSTSGVGLDVMVPQTAAVGSDITNGKADRIHDTTAEMLLSSNPNTQPSSPDLAKQPPALPSGEERDEVVRVLLDASQRIESSVGNDAKHEVAPDINSTEDLKSDIV